MFEMPSATTPYGFIRFCSCCQFYRHSCCLLLQEVTNGDQLLSNGSLVISHLTADSAGQYTCVASNMAGSGNATISVSYLGESDWLQTQVVM